jgi:hypothetical protein
VRFAKNMHPKNPSKSVHNYSRLIAGSL